MSLFEPPQPHVAFQPPSDMVGSGSGSSTTKKLFIGLGLGCGVVLIVIGILFAAGAFKAVTCCNEVKNIADTSVGAEQFAGEFAREIHQGEVEAAYARTSPQFQSDMPRESFDAAVEAHRDRLASNQPRMFNMQLEQHGDQKPSLEGMARGTWAMSYQFAGPQDETMLLLNFRVARSGSEDDAGFEVREVRFDERPRNLQHEPPAVEVLRVHEMIQSGQYELAYARLGDDFRSTADVEAWRAFLKEAGVVLTSSTLEVRQVSYNDANTQATVMAHAKVVGGNDAIIQFELQAATPELPGFGWRIVTIAPLLAESDTLEPPNAAPSNTNNAVGTNGSAGDAPVGEVPTVEVEDVVP